MQTRINRIEQNKDHKRIMREIRFRSSFKGLKISQSSQKNMHQSFFWDIMH